MALCDVPSAADGGDQRERLYLKVANAVLEVALTERERERANTPNLVKKCTPTPLRVRVWCVVVATAEVKCPLLSSSPFSP